MTRGPACLGPTVKRTGRRIMLTYTIDIFSGKYRAHGSFWIDAVAGFEEAYQMMLMLAAVKPGPYFIFDSRDESCAGNVDTTYTNHPTEAASKAPIQTPMAAISVRKRHTDEHETRTRAVCWIELIRRHGKT